MEFPYGHHGHHQETPPPPSPYPPPSHHHHHHQGGPPQPYYPPPPQHISHEVNPYPPRHPPPPPVHVQHVSHEQTRNIHIPSFLHHHKQAPPESSSGKPTVRVYCKAETGYSLTIRDHRVILARSDPNDMSQHWIKDEKYSTKVKDEQGFPSFALVNKATGQAIKHSIGHTHPAFVATSNEVHVKKLLIFQRFELIAEKAVIRIFLVGMKYKDKFKGRVIEIEDDFLEMMEIILRWRLGAAKKSEKRRKGRQNKRT